MNRTYRSPLGPPPRSGCARLVSAAVLLLASAAGLSAQTSSNYNIANINFTLRLPATNLIMLQAHRGLWQYVPENTTAAYDAALANNIEMLEIDIRQCGAPQKTGCLFVFHDEVVDRLTNGTGEVSSIAAAAFSNLYLKDRYGAFTGAHPLTFTQFLDYVKGKLTNNYTRGFAVVVDCKPAKDKVTFTEWTALMEGWNQMVSYTSNMTNSDALNFRDAFIWKIKARKLPPADGSNPLAASKAMEGLPFFWDANNRVRGQNLIAIYYSTDEDMKKPPYQNTLYGQLFTKPYLAQWEYAQGYSGDPAQQYIDYYAYLPRGYGKGQDVDFLSEGVATKASCCGFYLTHSPDSTIAAPDVSITPTPYPQCETTSPYSCWDNRGIFEWVANPNSRRGGGGLDHPSSIVTDAVLDGKQYLELNGWRNLARIR